MTSASTPTPTPGFTLAHRAQRMNPSIIREILKVTERPGIISLAGGLPSPDTFPVEALREACTRVLRDNPREALQYAASEGFGPLRDWVAAHLGAQGLACTAGQVLITTGSQQGLDLVGKVLIDPGSPVLVETPTYLGALQAFAPYEPQVTGVPSDEQGPLPSALRQMPDVARARFLYLLPNFQNPSGRLMGATRRAELVDEMDRLGLPLLEDNPYGDLWFDAPPPAPLSGRRPDMSLYLGSFSKILAPGLRLGYVVAPPALYPKLLQAKQAADLHTPGFNQRLVHEIIRDGFLDQHVPVIRAQYKAQRDAMRTAMEQHLAGVARWNAPSGGMFFWLELPAGMDALALLPRAVEAGVAFVPGAAFYADAPQSHTLRLSFVTVPPERIAAGIEILARVVKGALP